jgi:3-deoxy-D-manno-octulosonic-acid transferase
VAWLLNVIYLCLLSLLSPVLVWRAARYGKYRVGWKEKLLGCAPVRTSQKSCVWFHAVSVGEVNLLGTLIDALRVQRGDLEFVISTTTATGHAVATQRYTDHTIFYCPLDFSWAVNQALQRVRPDLLVLAELELWPNLILAANRRGVPVAVVNGRMSDRSFRGYRRLRPIIGWMLRKLDLIAVQSEQYAERFRQLGASDRSVICTGSLKFDGAATDRRNEQTVRLKQLAGISEDDIVFLAGSTQDPEERYAVAAFKQLIATHPRLRLILVPRHPERFDEVAKLLDQSSVPWQRRTALETTADRTARVLLVDKMGELRGWWGAATIAFVGGTFGEREGQNMIEPAAYGAAVSFGPRTRNFRDVVALLLARDAARVVRSAEELTAFVRESLEDPAFAADLGTRAQQLVLSQRGATDHTAQLLAKLLSATVISSQRAA